eukprot:1151457-Pelagomonas_calceolata.AAC.10
MHTHTHACMHALLLQRVASQLALLHRQLPVQRIDRLLKVLALLCEGCLLLCQGIINLALGGRQLIQLAVHAAGTKSKAK